jgi:N-acetylmuramoyl-L-alanine amidase
VSRVGAHTAGHNTGSIGIVYVGGLANDEDRGPKDTRTMAQKKAMHDLVEDLVHTYPIKRIAGHNEFSNKACPCFNAKQEFEHLT